MNRTASSRAFALNPCPADPLGRQMVYQHMSAHYRRMYSAQSVVDSAAPSKRRVPRKSASGANGGTPLGGPGIPPNLNSVVPSLKQAVPTKNNVRNTRVNKSDPGRNVRSRQSMRDGYSVVKPLPTTKLRERKETYLAKLDQIGKTTVQTEESAPNFKPRILPSNVQSRLRNSSLYHPPRPRALNRLKTADRVNEVKNPSETPRSNAQTSPPGSSRDSAYNGGISSGGESHLRGRLDPKKQKRRVWSSGLQETQRDELRPLGTPEGTIGDGGLVGSPAFSCFSSIISSHGRASEGGTKAYNRDNSGSFSGDIESPIEEGSHIEGAFEDESHFGDVSPVGESHFGDVSPVEECHFGDVSPDCHGDRSSQSGSDTFEEDIEETNRSPTIEMLDFALKNERKMLDQTIQVEDFIDSVKQSPVLTATNATSTTRSLHLLTSAATSATGLNETEVREVKSIGIGTVESDTELDEKSKWSDAAYIRLIHAFTNDAVKRGVLTNKALKAIFHEHVESNKHTLDMDRMLQEWEKFRLNLDIPNEDQETDNYGLGNTGHRADHFRPLTSEPGETWTGSTQQPRQFFVSSTYPSADATTTVSGLLEDPSRKTHLKIQDVYDPVSIMSSLECNTERHIPSFSPFTVTQRLTTDQASSPFPEQVYSAQSCELECVCGEAVCCCNSTEKLVGYMQKWIGSPDCTNRRHSVPDTKKSSKNIRSLRTLTPPLRTSESNTNTGEIRNSPSKSTDPVSDLVGTDSQRQDRWFRPIHPTKQERKTVRIAGTPQRLGKTEEKMLVSLYNPQHEFSSEDSVNEGIFGRVIVKPAKSPEIEAVVQSAATMKTQSTSPNPLDTSIGRTFNDPLLECTELNMCLGGSSYSSPPLFDDLTIGDSTFQVLDEPSVQPFLKWWEQDKSKTPKANIE